MQGISVNLTNDCDGNELDYNNDLPVIGNENYALQKPFETGFLTVIGNAKLLRLFIICWETQRMRPRCGPRHPILHPQHIFLCKKLLAPVILSWNSLKCILWYLLELSDPFIKNENSVLPILIEKSFEQKFTFVSWKCVLFFLKKGNPIFSIKLGQRLPKSFSQLHVKNSRFFLSYFLKKKTLGPKPTPAQGCRSPLLKFW